MLVIRGAYYKNEDSILVPHSTGDYNVVDCNEYIRKKEWKNRYYEEDWEGNKDHYVKVRGKKYYYAGFRPVYVGSEWEVLSDLSGISHTETDYDF